MVPVVSVKVSEPVYVYVCPFSTSYLTHLLRYRCQVGRKWNLTKATFNLTKIKLRFCFTKGIRKRVGETRMGICSGGILMTY